MKLQILPPEKLKKRAKDKITAWKKELEKEAKRSQLAGEKLQKELSPKGAHNEQSPNMQLWRAISRDDVQGAEAAIANGADISGKRRRSSPLVSAAGHGKVRMIQFLISKGMDLNARCDHGATALMAAVRKGHYKAAETLIHAGADVNAIVNRRYWRGMTALMFTWDIGIARLLLDNKADVKARDGTGKTALSHALNSGNTAVASLLREYGAKQ